ncbi:hypothetical protein BV20DRAFT_962538 [Pilatotrama ljubarskyi]|nr:hypothetical protein BV20DRAFT_962538 [Pilatotrama ljubarskyi]
MLTASPPSLLRRTRDAFLHNWGLLDWLRLLCSSLVFWYELGSFYHALRSCSWPDTPLRTHHALDPPTHVLLVADPHVRHSSTSSRVGFSPARQFLLDLAIKRNWHFASRTRPDVVLFLGDILASWRLVRSDKEYERNLDKFRRIFHLDPGVTSFYVPGNNDVGLNIEPAAARQARQRFMTHFGPLNQKVVLRNHTLVMLDAAGLVEEDYLRAAKYIGYEHWSPIPHGPVEFVRSLQDEPETQPTLLFTHIPLYRPDTASCGPLREKGTIRRGVGNGYQNTLGKKTTAFLLQTLKPKLVFSADDKDYCDYVHVPPKPVLTAAESGSQTNTTTEPVREITLKAFSPSHEIRYPSFQLLSLVAPSPYSSTERATEATVASTPCFLPDYTSHYTQRYVPLLLLTTLLLVLLRLRLHASSNRTNRPSSQLPLHARRSAFRQSFSLHSLPSFPSSFPHPPTPFSADWSPHTPGFVSPSRHARPQASVSPTRTSRNPTDELPRSIRTPAPVPGAGDGKNGDAQYAPGAGTPMFRATTHAREDSGGPVLGPQLVVFSADRDGDGEGAGEEMDDHVHDEFARGRHDPRRLSRAERGFPFDFAHFGGGADDVADPVDADAEAPKPGFEYTFTMGGQRRRVSVPSLVPRWARSFGSGAQSSGRDGVRRGVGVGLRRPGVGGAGGTGAGKRAFARRLAMDLVYVAWPGVLFWGWCAWKLQ